MKKTNWCTYYSSKPYSTVAVITSASITMATKICPSKWLNKSQKGMSISIYMCTVRNCIISIDVTSITVQQFCIKTADTVVFATNFVYRETNAHIMTYAYCKTYTCFNKCVNCATTIWHFILHLKEKERETLCKQFIYSKNPMQVNKWKIFLS